MAYDAVVDCADVPASTEAGHFIASALRAARHAQPSHRRTILADIASVLNCSATDLGFLFIDPVVAANDSDPVAMPDFRTASRAVAYH